MIRNGDVLIVVVIALVAGGYYATRQMLKFVSRMTEPYPAVQAEG